MCGIMLFLFYYSISGLTIRIVRETLIINYCLINI